MGSSTKILQRTAHTGISSTGQVGGSPVENPNAVTFLYNERNFSYVSVRTNCS